MLTGIRFIRVVLIALGLFVLGGVPSSALASSHPTPVSPKLAYASYWGGSGGEGCVPAILRRSSRAPLSAPASRSEPVSTINVAQ
jgi:hypothetical protein